MLTPEGKEKALVKVFLNEIGACHRWPVPYGYGRPDIDCHAAIAGVFWAIEVKKPGAEPTPIQWRTLREFEEAGAKVAWGTADDIIPVINRWMQDRAFGGPTNYCDSDPHATAQHCTRQANIDPPCGMPDKFGWSCCGRAATATGVRSISSAAAPAPAAERRSRSRSPR